MQLSNSSGYSVNLQYDQSNANSRFSWRLGPYSPRTKFIDRQGRPGSVQLADLQTGQRQITFEYTNYNTTESGFINQLENVSKVFNPQYEPFYLTDNVLGRRMQVYLNSLSQSPVRAGTDLKVGNVQLQLTSPDSCWEASTATVSGLVLGNTDSITITNPSAVPVYPVITVTAGVNNTAWRLTNETTSLFTQCENTSFISGSVAVINCETGRLTIDDQLANLSLGRGSGFWALMPGANVLRYRSDFSPVTVSVSFRALSTN